MQDVRHLTGNYRFAERVGDALTLEVQVITDGSAATTWITAGKDHLARLVEQISGGEQCLVAITNIRESGSGCSVTAYRVREVDDELDLNQEERRDRLHGHTRPVRRLVTEGGCRIVAYRQHDQFGAYTFEGWFDADHLDKIAWITAVPGDMRVYEVQQPDGAHPKFAIDIHGQRDWFPLVLGNTKGSVWLYETATIAKGAGMATHALMAERGEFDAA